MDILSHRTELYDTVRDTGTPAGVRLQVKAMLGGRKRLLWLLCRVNQSRKKSLVKGCRARDVQNQAYM